MVTGVEAAGLVLAVLPLCITACEHYEDAIKPYRALFRYQAELSQSKMDLYFVHASFTKTMQNLCSDASIADGAQFEHMVKDATSVGWLSNDSDHKLEQHLSDQGYHAYKIKANEICNRIIKVAEILSVGENILKEEATQGMRSTPWTGDKLASKMQAASISTPTALLSRSKLLKRRMKFILMGGTIGTLVKKVAEDTQQLDHLIEKSAYAQKTMQRSVKAKRKELFQRPFKEIETFASGLHRALGSVWSCLEHQSHCVNLRLDRRLRGENQAHSDPMVFTLNLAAPPAWHHLEVYTVGEPPGPNRAVGSQLPATIPPLAALAQLVVVHDLCQRANTKRTHICYCLDHNYRLLGDYPVPTPSAPGQAVCGTATLRSVLPELKAKQSMQLALTLVSSFLQLHSTPWLRDRWCAGEVVLFRVGDKLDFDQPYVSQTYPPTHGSTPNLLSDCDKLFALGTILLDISTQTPIVNKRTGANATLEDPSIMRSCLLNEADGWLDCFAESIRACSNYYHAHFDLDLKDPVTHAEVVEAVLCPFQRDLKWC
ncbi:hypothetical protein LTR56_001668 [Elasticomyces elasticus]|nr:hypothetical protein LTR56_001668 [Elasticomyces elasticus]KAK3667281.1 hypothetical protein LTR22_001797 [Elasticomyces elasticus]KAK4932641.1 hypothetical protein LTR49_001065 [Elasticomyces elasticus]KAK5769662.1 hypothetical protein LTS12_000112 [Elasticomyces elasticus]